MLSALVLWSMLSACDSGAPSRTLRAVTPTVVSNGIDSTVTVEGTGFLAIPLVALGSQSRASLRTTYSVRVGDVLSVDGLTPKSTEAIEFVVPAGLTPGVYDVELLAPAGDALQLKAALTIMDAIEPENPHKLSLETRADGTGERVAGRTLKTGESLEVFALLRDSFDELVSGEEGEVVRFSQEPVLGVLSEAYASHTVFGARLPGDMVLHAVSDTSLTSDVTIKVTAEADKRYVLSIEDAPGGMGQSIATALNKRAGDQLSCYAVARDATGAFVLDVPATWQLTGAQTAAAANAESFGVTFQKTGVSEIKASYVGFDPDAVQVTVAAARAAELSMDPESATLRVGDAPVKFVVTAKDAFGNATQDIGNLSYAIVDGAFGDFVPANATLTPVRVGSGHIFVESSYGPELTSGQIEVTAGVLARLSLTPDTMQLSADDPPVQFEVQGFDAFDNETDELGTLTWSVVNGTVATLGEQGEFDPTTVGTGMVNVTSSLGASATSGTIEVTAGALAALSIQPQTWSGKVGDAAQQFTVTGADADGNAVADVGTLSYHIASGPITAIDATTGVFTPTTAGVGTIEVTSSYGLLDTTQNIVVSPVGATLRVSAMRVPSFVWEEQLGVRVEVDVASTDPQEVAISGMGLTFTQSSDDTTEAFTVVPDRANRDRIPPGTTQTLVYFVDVAADLGLTSITITATGEAFPTSGAPFVFARSVTTSRSLAISTPSELRFTAPVAPADRTCAGGRVNFGADTSNLLSPSYDWRFPGGTIASGSSTSSAAPAVDYPTVGNFIYQVTATYLGSPSTILGTPIYVGTVGASAADTYPTGHLVFEAPSAGQVVTLASFPRSDLITVNPSLPVRQCNGAAVDPAGHNLLTVFSDRGLIDMSADVDTAAPGIQMRLTTAGVLGSVPLSAPSQRLEGSTTLYAEYFDATSGAVTAAGDTTFRLSADVQAPTVQWSIPSSDCGSACLSPGDPLVFQFSEPISLTSLSNTRVEVFSGSMCTGTATNVTSAAERTYEPSARALYIDPAARTGSYALRVQVPSTVTDNATAKNALTPLSRCVVFSSLAAAVTPATPQLTAAVAAKFSPDGDGLADTLTWKVSADSATSYLRLRVTRAGDTLWSRLAPTPTAGEYTFIWDGGDEGGRIVTDGIYGYAIEAINRAGTASAALRGYVEVDSAVRMVSIRRAQ